MTRLAAALAAFAAFTWWTWLIYENGQADAWRESEAFRRGQA